MKNDYLLTPFYGVGEAQFAMQKDYLEGFAHPLFIEGHMD
ncbi:hypothetical protein N781_14875 [Pontibacillus halophilus JSM 076056 = DSM 19796]|uniref:Uncharacterized protein n=1 Tax=Pontibacillus halophilus JSM 076056 = DSM 19796 TaxID=1385510 RepID=A0A0A5GNF1_9BACI|nr:hypothetical protein N781_14875 [Pontibacillus halophilus JSM 076056 = DSM 19796]